MEDDGHKEIHVSVRCGKKLPTRPLAVDATNSQAREPGDGVCLPRDYVLDEEIVANLQIVRKPTNIMKKQ